MPAAAASPPIEPDRRRVLIIDDDIDFASAQADFLEEYGYEVHLAHDNLSAQKAIATFDAQIALIDLKLGNTSGVKLIRGLQDVSPDLVCIMITGYGDMESAIQAMRQGATDFLKKPVNLDELLAVMERCIKTQQLIKEKNASEMARQEADAANQAKSQFLANMSHELRTPMNAILGFAQILENSPSEPLSETQKSHVRHIIKGGDNLLELINQVLELNEIQARGLSPDIGYVPPQDVIERSIDLIQARADQKGIKIFNQTTDTDLPMLWTDREQLTRVIYHLLSNAVKYNREDGSVTLSCHRTPDQMLRINVEDTGRGISAENHFSLFKPFERLGREAGVIEGAGIGLILAKQTIELLSGQIGFESEEGKGSTFWVEVPLFGKNTVR